MSLVYEYSIKLCENSFDKDGLHEKKKCYKESYSYRYVIKSKYMFTINNEYTEIIFKYKGYYYLIFHSDTRKNKIDINTTKSNEKFYITFYIVRPGSYLHFNPLNKSKYKIFEEIKLNYFNSILKSPYLIESPWFTMITTDKLLYYNYFINKKIIHNTSIQKLPLYKINKLLLEQKYIIKAPYSAASDCVTYDKITNKCFIDNGIIISKPNKSYVELKCFVFKGRPLFYVIQPFHEFKPHGRTSKTIKILLTNKFKYASI